MNMSIKGIFISNIFICWALFMFTSTQAQDWPKIYGNNFDALIKKISETYDKGFFLTTFTYNDQGASEYGWLIKININGNFLWDKKYGDGIYGNWFSSSYITFDDGLIISGITNKYSAGDYDPLFIKVNVCGETDWCKVLVCPDQNYGTDVLQTRDGSYIGLLTYYGMDSTYARISLIKMDQSGEPIWIKRLAQQDTLIYNEEGYNLIQTNDSNYLISGRVYYPGMKPYWILTDTAGEQLWDLKWDAVTGICFQTIENLPGIFYSIGYKIPPGHQNLPTVFKFDKNGNQRDDFLLLGDTIYRGGGGSIMKLNDSTLLSGVVWGSITSGNEIIRSEILQSDTLGNIENRRILLVEDQSPKCLLLSSDNKILVAGNYVVDGNWDIYLWKMNQDLEDDTLYNQPMTYDSLCPYQITSDTVDLDCGLFVNIDELPTKEEYESTIKIYPNPAREWIALTLPDIVAPGRIELKIYNNFGQEIMKKAVIPGNRVVSCNISEFSAGFYLAVCKDSHGRTFKGKFIVGK
jgi:hypothetical protein